MSICNTDQIENAVSFLTREHPILSPHENRIIILLVGSCGSGFADEYSDLDLWVMVPDEQAGDLAREFEQAGLRFMAPPPNDLQLDGVTAHYFVFPSRRFRQALEAYDDETLFVLERSQALHDPSGQIAALRAEFAALPDEIVTSSPPR